MTALHPSQTTDDNLPKILVVDDTERIRVTIEKLFTQEGFQVLTAAGASSCREHLNQGFHGIILMDVVMPEKDGWETIREMEQAGLLKGSIVVVLTGVPAPLRMEGLQEVVVDFVNKPFRAEELVAIVRKYAGYLNQAYPGQV